VSTRSSRWLATTNYLSGEAERARVVGSMTGERRIALAASAVPSVGANFIMLFPASAVTLPA
jgi:hypothetical protein